MIGPLAYAFPLSLFSLGVGYVVVINIIQKSRLADKYVRVAFFYVWIFASGAGILLGPQIYESVNDFIVFIIFTTLFSGVTLYLAFTYSKRRIEP
jgi:FtsH-binding integral membrane protein